MNGCVCVCVGVYVGLWGLVEIHSQASSAVRELGATDKTGSLASELHASFSRGISVGGGGRQTQPSDM